MKGGPRAPPGADEPNVRVLSLEAHPGTASAQPPAEHPKPSAWTVWVVAAVGAAALGYGFMLGRGTGTGPTSTMGVGASSTLADIPPATAAPADPTGGSLTEEFVSFIRAQPDHDLGRGVTEYLATPEFETIAVDADGVVWLGGSTGLVRFDPIASDFLHLTQTDGTGPLDVQAIALGPDRSVWVTTSNGLSRWDGEGWTTGIRVAATGSLDRQTGPLDIGPDGTIWLATHQWDAASGLEHSQIHRSPPPFVGDVATVTIQGYVSDIATAGSEVWALAESQVWRNAGGWGRVDIDAWWLDRLAVATDGTVWLAGGDTVMRQDGTGFIEVAWTPPAADPEGEDEPFGGETWIQSLAAGPDGGMWGLVHQFGYGLQDDGIYIVRFDGEAVEAHPVPNRGDGSWPRQLTVGPDGTVWIAAGSAVLGFDGTGWSEFRPEESLPIGSISSMAADRHGNVWMAGEAGIVEKAGTDWKVFGRTELGLPEPGGPDEPGQYWVATDPTGDVWGGTGNRAFRFRDGAWAPLPLLPAGSADWWEVNAGVTADGTLWLVVACCDWESPLYRFRSEAWEAVEPPPAGQTSEPGAPSEIAELAFTADGSVWAAGGSGISRYSAGEWTTMFGGESFTSIAVAGDGSIWAAPNAWSEPGGLWRYLDGSWNVTASSLRTEALVTGPDGTVWALQGDPGKRTVVRDTATRGVRWIVESGGLSDMVVANDGTIWMGGDGRLYQVDPPV